jgi:hypothetical protein
VRAKLIPEAPAAQHPQADRSVQAAAGRWSRVRHIGDSSRLAAVAWRFRRADDPVNGVALQMFSGAMSLIVALQAESNVPVSTTMGAADLQRVR